MKEKSNQLSPQNSPRTQALLDYLSFSEVKELLLRFRSLGVATVTVVSELPKEGKSFFCAVLAASVARSESGKRCLIVDAGAHFPERSTLFDDTVEPLENVDVVQIGETEANLSELLERVRGQYDLIVVDTCPLQMRNRRNLDPLLLARMTDGAILMSSEKSLASNKVKTESQRLSAAGVKLLGVMHNQFIAEETPKKEVSRGLSG